MTRNIFRTTFLAILLAGLAALPGIAQTINPGIDWWVTPANDKTYVTFAAGDVESLCGLGPVASWNHKVKFQGIPQQGQDWDTAVARLDKAVFNAAGTAVTRIQVKTLAFASTAPQATPCGLLSWTAGLSGVQPITQMTINHTTTGGGVFFAKISVKVELRATDVNTGNYVGSLFYVIDLPDPPGGTPWSFGTAGNFRPGMTETDNCIDVLRAKLSTFDPDSEHWYFISNLIAQGKCHE